MNKELFFHSADYEKAVREELNLPKGPITLSSALKVKSLDFNECHFLEDDLDTLYLFENLEELYFFKNDGIIDFEMFTPFKKLKDLCIGGYWASEVKLINVGVLNQLKSLECLSIKDFGSIDLTGLDQLQQLKELLIGWGDVVTNVDLIGTLKNLRYLELYDIKLKNLNFINQLSHDTQIELGGISVVDPFDIKNFKQFKSCEYEMIEVNGEMLTFLQDD